MKGNRDVSIQKITSILLYVFIGVLVLNKGAVYYPDSYAFLSMAFNRSPVYCLFLKGITSIFTDYYELPVIVIQYVLIVYGVHYMIRTINKVFHVGFLGLVFLQLILLAPCVYLHFVANTILSEGICYALCLIVMAQIFKLFIEEDLKYIYKIAPVLFILILTRGQFIVAIPILLLVSVYVILKRKTPIRKASILFIVLLVPILSGATEKLYHKVVFGHAVNNAMSYVHLISASFYISDASDVAIFNDEEEKAYFKLVHGSLEEANLTRTQIKLNEEEDDYAVFLANFPKICNERVHELGLAFYKEKGLDYYEQNIALNTLCSQMVFPLLTKNIKKWIVFYYKGLKTTFGSSKEMLLFMMLLIFGLVYMFKTDNPLYKFMALATFFMFMNNALIAFVVHANKRYVFYFDWIIFAIMILLLNEIFKQSKQTP